MHSFKEFLLENKKKTLVMCDIDLSGEPISDFRLNNIPQSYFDKFAKVILLWNGLKSKCYGKDYPPRWENVSGFWNKKSLSKFTIVKKNFCWARKKVDKYIEKNPNDPDLYNSLLKVVDTIKRPEWYLENKDEHFNGDITLIGGLMYHCLVEVHSCFGNSITVDWDKVYGKDIKNKNDYLNYYYEGYFD